MNVMERAARWTISRIKYTINWTGSQKVDGARILFAQGCGGALLFPHQRPEGEKIDDS
jgi:hypothetical protein